MSSYYGNKCLLITKADLDLGEAVGVADLEAHLYDYVEMQFGESEPPSLEVIAVCSQRENQTWCADRSDAAPKWLSEELNWDQILVRITAERLALDEDTASKICSDPATAEPILKNMMFDDLRDENYGALSRRADALSSLNSGTAPGLLGWNSFVKEELDQAIDLREARDPADPGLLVEIAYHWR
ncbi:hypothetical protein BMG03_19210 (plasmid) [Thioclava nitratireducens]|uniref:Uncharacterized protein n=1 Tax=Thioclava nitratireducens TaxID=1915078 RepID=A0ABN4XFI8_9RHOB|nr:hypothetical protein [Thioclava nitratireducens]AQS50055.1 hypothetical protein BMG03_19210 [Thioclava nitratireducens]